MADNIVNNHRRNRGQSYSRSQRRRVLKQRYGKDWKDHEFKLSRVDAVAQDKGLS